MRKKVKHEKVKVPHVGNRLLEQLRGLVGLFCSSRFEQKLEETGKRCLEGLFSSQRDYRVTAPCRRHVTKVSIKEEQRPGSASIREGSGSGRSQEVPGPRSHGYVKKTVNSRAWQ